MKARIFIKDGDSQKLLAEVENLEVVPRGIYVIDGKAYQYTGQPTFIIREQEAFGDRFHSLERVDFTVQEWTPGD